MATSCTHQLPRRAGKPSTVCSSFDLLQRACVTFKILGTKEKMAPSMPGTSLVPERVGDFSRFDLRLFGRCRFLHEWNTNCSSPVAGSRACLGLEQLRKFIQRHVIILHKCSWRPWEEVPEAACLDGVGPAGICVPSFRS